MKAEELFAKGWAVAAYDILACEHIIRFRDELYRIPFMRIAPTYIDRMPCVRIEEVRKLIDA